MHPASWMQTHIDRPVLEGNTVFWSQRLLLDLSITSGGKGEIMCWLVILPFRPILLVYCAFEIIKL